MAAIEPYPGFEEDRFVTENGDGGPLVHERLVMRRMTASWFPRRLGNWSGDAWLLEVTEGPRTGTLIGLTPRQQAEIEDQIDHTTQRAGVIERRVGVAPHWPNGWSSVVLHELHEPGPGFTGSTFATGMTVLVRIRSGALPMPR